LKIIIDGQDDLLQVNDNLNILGFAEQLDSTLYSSGRVIQKIELGQQELQLDQLEETLLKSSLKDSCLNIETVSLQEHLKLSLLSMQQGIEELENQAIEISDQMLREGQLGMNELAVWAGDLGNMANNIRQLIQMFQIDQNDLKIGNLSFDAGLNKLKQFTTLVIGALQQNKKVAISDILQFKIADLVADFKSIFPILIERVEQKLA
jgi:hypothetical protein